LTRRLQQELELVQPIGTGGMAQVYLARQKGLARMVAVKILRSLEATDHIRFLREARTLASLRHPGVVQVLDFDADDQSACLVMEFLEAGTLADRMRLSSLSSDQVVNIFSQLVDILVYTHSQGVVHRDVKPANVFIDKSDVVKLGDFGLAIVEGGARLTHPGYVLGTLTYMAPEQLLDGAIGPAADQFALGVLLYELLSGRNPFAVAETTDLVKCRLEQKVPHLGQLVPGLRPDLAAGIMQMLHPDPRHRHPDLAVVRAFLMSGPVMQPGATVSPKAHGTNQTLVIPRATRRGPIVLGALAVVLTLVGLVGMASHRRPPAVPTAPASLPAFQIEIPFDRWRHIAIPDLQAMQPTGPGLLTYKRLEERVGFRPRRSPAIWSLWRHLGTWLSQRPTGPIPSLPVERVSLNIAAEYLRSLSKGAPREEIETHLALELILSVPKDATGWLHLGRLMDLAGRNEAARTLYRLALERDAIVQETWPRLTCQALARATFPLGLERAWEVWRAWASRKPVNVNAGWGLAEAAAAGDFNWAEAMLERACKDRNLEVTALKGMTQLPLFPSSRLNDLLPPCFRGHPDDMDLRDSVVRAQGQVGRILRAMETLRPTIRDDSDRAIFSMLKDIQHGTSALFRDEPRDAAMVPSHRIDIAIEKQDPVTVAGWVQFLKKSNQLDENWVQKSLIAILGLGVCTDEILAKAKPLVDLRKYCASGPYTDVLDGLSTPAGAPLLLKLLDEGSMTKDAQVILGMKAVLAARLGDYTTARRLLEQFCAFPKPRFLSLPYEALFRVAFGTGYMEGKGREPLPLPRVNPQWPPRPREQLEVLGEALANRHPEAVAMACLSLFDIDRMSPAWALGACWGLLASRKPWTDDLNPDRFIRSWRFQLLLPVYRGELSRLPAAPGTQPRR
jgi:serine/threonine protein kinase